MEKSQAAGFLLTLFFGPLGLLYSSIPAALFLTAVGLVYSWATATVMGVIVVWPLASLNGGRHLGAVRIGIAQDNGGWNMKRHHSFLKALAGSILLACLGGVQYACQVDAPGHTESEERMDAEHPRAARDGEVHWSYEGDTGSERWGGLDPSFAICDGGAQQSPINLAGAIPAGGGGLQIQWQPTDGEVVDNGHTIQVNLVAGGGITLEDRQFSLLQFHFHLPSEHTVDGSSFPMEVHFVHQAEQGDLAVIGVFMDAGEAHLALQAVWDAIPGAEETPVRLAGFDPNALLPEGRGYSRYAGSLTTPPCSEEVSWVVMGEPIWVSQAQVDAFAALYPMNARPVQPLHRRFILMR